jgi:hypothetical protein
LLIDPKVGASSNLGLKLANACGVFSFQADALLINYKD